MRFPHSAGFRFRRHVLVLVCCLSIALYLVSPLRSWPMWLLSLLVVPAICLLGFGAGMALTFSCVILFGQKLPKTVSVAVLLVFYGFSVAALVQLWRVAFAIPTHTAGSYEWVGYLGMAPAWIGWAWGAMWAYKKHGVMGSASVA
jgi:hypothetical protein